MPKPKLKLKPKPKLLLLHGALGAAAQFDELQKLLEPHFEIFTFSFTGHGGRSIPQNPFSIKNFADEVIAFLDQHQFETINIFGYSMGGYVALWLARHIPRGVDKIFTLATKLDWNESSASREAAMLNPEKMEEKIPSFVNELSKRHAPQDWKSVVVKTREMMLELGRHHLEESDFRLITNKICISVGDRDTMVSIEESTAVSQWLTNGSLFILPNTLHPFEKINIERLSIELKRFFN